MAFDIVRQIVESRLFSSKFYAIKQSDFDFDSGNTGTNNFPLNGKIVSSANKQFPGLGLTVAQLKTLNPNLGNSVGSFGRAVGDTLLVQSAASITTFPLFLEGRQFTQPSTKWSVLTIDDSSVVGREFGISGKTSRGFLHSGTVRLKLYAPHGTGTKVARDMADELDGLLSYTAGDNDTGNGGNLFMKSGSLRQVSENKDGFLEYNLDYIYDYYTS